MESLLRSTDSGISEYFLALMERIIPLFVDELLSHIRYVEIDVMLGTNLIAVKVLDAGPPSVDGGARLAVRRVVLDV